MIYSTKHDDNILQNFIELFLNNYKNLIDCDFNHLNDGFSEEGPHLTRLPDGILEVFGANLARSATALTKLFVPAVTLEASGDTKETGAVVDTERTRLLKFSQKIVSCLIVLCRNNDNVYLIASCEFVSYVILIGSLSVEQICEQDGDSELHVSFIEHVIHLLECLYDPYFLWRKRLRGWSVDRVRQTCRPALLHNEVVPFFHECFQKTGLSSDIQLRLLHLFGAIMSGTQTNALKAITPATLDVLLKVLAAGAVQGPTNAQRQAAATLKDLVLKCIVRMVHVIHECSPDQRQIEVSEVMHGYMQVLLSITMETTAEVDCKMQITMINMINEMMASNDKSGLQVTMINGGTFDGFVALLCKTTLTGIDAQQLAMAVVRVMQAILSGSPSAKVLFEGRVGYQRFVEALKSLGQPSKELLQTLLDMVVEDSSGGSRKMWVVNSQAAMILLQWLPDIQSHDLQVWLARELVSVCSSGHRSRMSCCAAGMIEQIVTVLRRQKQINSKAVGHLIGLLETLGTLSITARELKQLISLFVVDDEGKQNPYTTRLMRAIATMARREGKDTALNFFDLHKPSDCISLPAVRKWLGPAFSFHAWVCLDTEVDMRKHSLLGFQAFRRQLYTLNDGSNHGLEAFITPTDDFVVAVYNRKDYTTLTVADTGLVDGLWHSVGVVHVAARRPFTQSQVIVYIDGKQKMSTPFKFPNLSESFSTCRIGSPSPHYSSEVYPDSSTKPDQKKATVSPLKAFFGGVAKSTSGSTTPAPGVLNHPAGSQDEIWGPPITLHGRVSTVCIFSDTIQPVQFRALNSVGPNDMAVFKDEADLADLPLKLFARYSAKACKEHVCADLSPFQNHGQFFGERCVAWDIKDTINCVGGIQALFPLLEQVDPEAPAPTPAPTPATTPVNGNPMGDSGEGWVILETSSYADSKLEQSQVASFLTLLRYMLQTKPINQDTFIRSHGAAILGALLQKATPKLIDVNVLMAVQLLVEACSTTNKLLISHLHQYILFDFRVWSKSAFPVRIGHIQYLSTIIKDDRKFFRKKYGVQFFLDIIRTYYTSTEQSGLSDEDNKTIRVALLNLIKFYISRDITADELSQIVGFIVVTKQQDLILESLDLILQLLEGRKYDQLFVLLFEPEQGDMLYKLLTYKGYSIIFYEKVVKVLWVLLKTDRVYDKSKNRLRLLDVGHWGLVTMMSEYSISVPMVKRFVEQVSYVDTGQSYNSILAVLSLIHNCDIDIKLEASRQLLKIVVSKEKDAAAKNFAKQLAWQDTLVRLLIADDPQDNLTHLTQHRNSVFAPIIDESRAQGDGDEETEAGEEMQPEEGLEESVSESSSDLPLNASTPLRPKRLDMVSSSDSLLDVPGAGGLRTPTTPMFVHAREFEDLNVSEETTPERSLSASRSSSASAEDLSTLGQRVAASQRNSASLSMSTSLDNMVESESTNSLSSAAISDLGEVTSRRASSVVENLQKETVALAEEHCQNILICLLTIMWKGLDGSDKAVWKERGQVFVCINKANQSHTLVHPRLVLKRRLLEMMLQFCSTDIRNSAQPLAIHTENAIELVRMVWGFISTESDHSGQAFSEQLLMELMTLLDLLGVWDTEAGHGWTEMIHLGFHILLVFASQPQLNLCSAATVKLTMLVQTKLINSSAEASFILGYLHDLVVKAVQEDTLNYAYLMNVLKALIGRAHTLLTIDHLLPLLPDNAQKPTFFDDFRAFCTAPEWLSLIQNYIMPQYNHFMESHFGETGANLNMFWIECQEAVEVTYHLRNREIGDSKLKLQSQVFDAFSGRRSSEARRFQNLLMQQRNQHLSTLRQWNATKKFYTSERGAWREKSSLAPEPLLHWKLSNQENFSRMRVKMVPNFLFDPHLKASQQRDNLGGPSDVDAIAAEKIRVRKEALVSKDKMAEDTLGDEEWDVISAADAKMEEYTGKEKLVISEDVELVTLVDLIKGRLEVTTTHIYFFDCSSNKEEGGEDFKWSLNQLREIHFRRYNLRRSALEIFLIDQTNCFINFPRKLMRNKVYSRILSLRPSNLSYYGTRSPAELLKASNLTQKWVQREISNFDYLMQLNTIAGRTFNDLSQYPVFPWILCDYESEELDLNNPAVFRDLSKPVGVVNPKNEEEVRDKYDTFEDPTGTIEKFHYGTHYSNAAGVMHYMVRLEPFTTLHIQLQSGKFDVADRQFHSIPGSWSTLMINPNDVKELIPEFFYLPEFLVNVDGFNLGRLQISRDQVNDVILPRWASSSEEFIYKHRQALESEYVSSQLNNWIDLIFGYKQKGPAAVEALNVFYYVTYEGAVDLDAIQNPRERASLEGMINNFGQTPTQLLKEPHPKCLTFEEAVSRNHKLGRPMSIFYFLTDLKPFFVEVSGSSDPMVYVNVPRSQTRSILQKGMPDNMVTVTEDGIIGVHGWLPFDKNINFYYTFEKDATMLNLKTKRRIGGPFAPGLKMAPKLFAVTPDARLLVSGGYWDNSLQVYRLDKATTVNHIVRHIDIITCLSMDHVGRHLITGSRDTTCMVWEIQQHSGYCHNINPATVKTLYGHDDEITAVHISIELDLAVSASKDGTVIVHAVRQCLYMRTLRPPCDPGNCLDIPYLLVSDMGQMVLCCMETNPLGKVDKHILHQYSVNGKYLCSRRVSTAASHMAVTTDHLVMGDNEGTLTVFQLFGLKPLSALQLLVPIQCLTVTNGNSHILVGLRDGKLIIVGIKGKADSR